MRSLIHGPSWEKSMLSVYGSVRYDLEIEKIHFFDQVQSLETKTKGTKKQKFKCRRTSNLADQGVCAFLSP